MQSSATLRHAGETATASISGVAETYFAARDVTLAAGGLFTMEDVAARAQVAVTDTRTRDTLFGAGADPLDAVLLVGRVLLRIVGVVNPPAGFGGNDSVNVHMPYTTAQTRLLGSTVLRSITLRVADDADMRAPEQAVTALLAERHGRKDFFIVNTDEIGVRMAARVGILTDAGAVFCAGMDLHAGFVSAATSKPLIAAVEGPALAGGFELALACDMIVASSTVTFGLPEPGVGIYAVGGGAFRLGRRIPPARAAVLSLTGERLSADEADRLGLLTSLVAPGDALATALDLAARIARNAPRAVRASLELVRAARALDEVALWSLSDRLWADVAASPDATEGPRAFREKRPAAWNDTGV